jgi:hypothetical protein
MRHQNNSLCQQPQSQAQAMRTLLLLPGGEPMYFYSDLMPQAEETFQPGQDTYIQRGSKGTHWIDFMQLYRCLIQTDTIQSEINMRRN